MAAHIESEETWTCSHCGATATVRYWSCGCVRLKWQTPNVRHCKRCDEAPHEKFGPDYPDCKSNDYGVAHRPQRESGEREHKERRSSSGGGGGGGSGGGGGGGGSGGDTIGGVIGLIVLGCVIAVIKFIYDNWATIVKIFMAVCIAGAIYAYVKSNARIRRILLCVYLAIGLIGAGVYVASQNQAAAEAAARAQAEDQARQAEVIRLAERLRVERGIAGEWSNGASRLTITKDGDTFRAEYPTENSRGPWLSPVAGLQRLHGEILHDNRLQLANDNRGKLLNPALGYYDGDFSQVAWLQLSVDSSFLIVRFGQAEGGRSLVMNRVVR